MTNALQGTANTPQRGRDGRRWAAFGLAGFGGVMDEAVFQLGISQ